MKHIGRRGHHTVKARGHARLKTKALHARSAHHTSVAQAARAVGLPTSTSTQRSRVTHSGGETIVQ